MSNRIALNTYRVPQEVLAEPRLASTDSLMLLMVSAGASVDRAEGAVRRLESSLSGTELGELNIGDALDYVNAFAFNLDLCLQDISEPSDVHVSHHEDLEAAGIGVSDTLWGISIAYPRWKVTEANGYATISVALGRG